MIILKAVPETEEDDPVSVFSKRVNERSRRMKKVVAAAKFTFWRNFKRSSYWSGIVWPFSVFILLLAFFLDPMYRGSVTFGLQKIELVLIASIFTVGLVFSPIIGKETEKDRSSKIDEFLWSMSGPHPQFVGRFMGVMLLVAVSILIYALGLCVVYGYSNWFRGVLRFFGLRNSIFTLLLLFQATLWLLTFAANISIFVKNRSHLSQALLAIPVYVVLCGDIGGQLRNHVMYNFQVEVSVFLIPVLSQLLAINKAIHTSNLWFVLYMLCQFLLWVGYFRYVLKIYGNYL